MQALETLVNGIEKMGGKAGPNSSVFPNHYFSPNDKASASMNLSFSCRRVLFHDERGKRREANYKDIRVEEVTAASRQAPLNHCP